VWGCWHSPAHAGGKLRSHYCGCFAAGPALPLVVLGPESCAVSPVCVHVAPLSPCCTLQHFILHHKPQGLQQSSGYLLPGRLSCIITVSESDWEGDGCRYAGGEFLQMVCLALAVRELLTVPLAASCAVPMPVVVL